jgi:hypothetical protein
MKAWLLFFSCLIAIPALSQQVSVAELEKLSAAGSRKIHRFLVKKGYEITDKVHNEWKACKATDCYLFYLNPKTNAIRYTTLDSNEYHNIIHELKERKYERDVSVYKYPLTFYTSSHWVSVEYKESYTEQGPAVYYSVTVAKKDRPAKIKRQLR